MCSLIEFNLDMDAIKTVVQTRTLLAVLDSIATQVKKLMEIKENAIKAVNKFATAKEQQQWMKYQCECVENLQNAISKLLVASSNLHQNDLKDSKNVLANVGDEFRSSLRVLGDKINDERAWFELEKSVKSLLHAIIKIALANDDIAIAKITHLLGEAKKYFIYFLSEHEYSVMDEKFMEFLNWMLRASQSLSTRQQEIICHEIKRTILFNVFLVKKISAIIKQMIAVPNSESGSLSQHYEALKISLGNKILKGISVLIETIQRGTSVPQDNVYTKSNTFAFTIQRVLIRLRFNESGWEPRFDLLVQSVIKHSLHIADLSQHQSKDIIIGFSNEVIRLHRQLVTTNEVLSKHETSNLRLQYTLKCNSLLDELENLQYHVNLAMLDIILEAFLHAENQEIPEIAANAEDVFKACTLIAESSTNINGICCMGATVQTLRFLRKQLNCAKGEEILHFLSSSYFTQLSSITHFLEEIADPMAIVNITLFRLQKDISQLKQVLYAQSNDDMSPIVNKIIARAQRVLRVSRKRAMPQVQTNDFENVISNLDTAIFAFVATVQQKQENVTDLQAHRHLYKHAKILMSCVEKLQTVFQTLNQEDTWNTNTCCANSSTNTLGQSKLCRTVFSCKNIPDTVMEDPVNDTNCQTLCNNLTEVLEALSGMANTFDLIQSTVITKTSPSLKSTSCDVSDLSCPSTFISTPERLADIERIVQKMQQLRIQPISGLSQESYQFF